MRGLRPYQEAGIQWLLGGPWRGLADEAGLGKTVQAASALQTLRPESAVVVCPASVVPVWRRHLEEWAPDVSAEVLSYDAVRRRGARTLRPDVLVVDEAHYLKTPDAARTKAVYGPQGVAQRTGRVWLLSATPAPNHPGEHWTHLSAAGLTRLRYAEFLRRYCHVRQTPYGPQVMGLRAGTTPELLAVVRRLWMRRRLADVGEQLPPLTWAELPLAVPKSGDVEAFCRRHAQASALAAALAAGAEDDELLAILERAAPHLATLRRLIGTLKVPVVLDWLRDFLLEPERKIVVWALHHDVINALHVALLEDGIGVVQLTGATAPAQRRSVVERFQSDPACRVFVGQVQAAGTGITLTAADTALFVELPWVPGDLYQAAKRIHRIGQSRPATVYVASIAGTIDDAVARILSRKAKMQTQLEA